MSRGCFVRPVVSGGSGGRTYNPSGRMYNCAGVVSKRGGLVGTRLRHK